MTISYNLGRFNDLYNLKHLRKHNYELIEEVVGYTLLADTIRKAHVQSYFTVTFRFFQYKLAIVLQAKSQIFRTFLSCQIFQMAVVTQLQFGGCAAEVLS